MSKPYSKRFPNESDEYRTARNALLEEEMQLRAHIEHIAEKRKLLPKGGQLKEDYEFSGESGKVKFSELFSPDKNSLVVYSMMFDPADDVPCPLCTSIVDGLDGQAPHISDKVNFVVIAKAPIEKILHFSQRRGWDKIRFLSSYHNAYNRDYHAEENGQQMPMLNVFEKNDGQIYHYYGSELLFAPAEKGQDPRHVDLLWPLWNIFDLTPEGRGIDWYPKISY